MATDPKSLLHLDGDAGGDVLISADTPLSRLNYYDGKLLKAADLEHEQRYLRSLVALSNQGLGWGVVYGFDTTGTGDTLSIGPGLAIDAGGNPLYLPEHTTVSIQELIDARTQAGAGKEPDSTGKTDAFGDCVNAAAPPPVDLLPASDLWIIVICRAEAMCGQEDVYGKLCEAACITSTDRPYRMEGVVVRAIPLALVTPFPTSKAVAIDGPLYLRSKVAHSYFGDELLKHPSAISGAGLRSGTWCLGAGYDASCQEVPLAVVARSGKTTAFLDAWIARRERMAAPARRYWHWKMRQRPWDVFLAQVLQFQCQLAKVLLPLPAEGEPDPCHDSSAVLTQAGLFLDQLREAAGTGNRLSELKLSFTRIAGVRQQIDAVLKSFANQTIATDRVLIRHGIIELPPAGYLPVVLGTSASVNEQVRNLLGEGLDYRFCVVTPDFVAHAFEEAQHMDRISLLQGLDDPDHKPKVDVLVPDGVISQATTTPDATSYEALLTASTTETGGVFGKGAAREERRAGSDLSLYVAGVGLGQSAVSRLTNVAAPENIASATLNANLRENPFVARDPTASPEFISAVATAAARARVGRFRRVFARPTEPVTPIEVGVPPTEVVVTAGAEAEPVTGFWIEATTDKSFRDLPLHGQATVNGRILAAQTSGLGASVEVAIQGTLTAIEVTPATAGGPAAMRARMQPILSMTYSKDQPTAGTELDVVFTMRPDLELLFTFEGTPAFGSVTVDISVLKGQGTQPKLRVKRSASGVRVEYAVSLAVKEEYFPVAALELQSNLDVLRPENAHHRLAEQGLDVVQGLRLLSEPDFRAVAEPRLFPPLPAATTELRIEPRLDWVLFHKRREKLCTAVFPQPEVKPPRPYRVLEITAPNAERAQVVIQQLSDPAALAEMVKELSGKPPFLTVSFAGGTATPLFDSTAVEQDWKQFDPGNRIAHVFYGSIEDDDLGLQTSRLVQLEDAIDQVSKEDQPPHRTPLVPFPDAARPADADGLMLFVTIAAAKTTCNEVIQFTFSNPNSERSQWSAFVKLLQSVDQNPGVLEEIEKFLQRMKTRNLGQVIFNEGTDQIPDGSGTAVADKIKDQNVNRMVVWHRSADPQAASRLSQGQRIKTLFAHVRPNLTVEEVSTNTAPKVTALGNGTTVESTCPSLVFVGTLPR